MNVNETDSDDTAHMAEQIKALLFLADLAGVTHAVSNDLVARLIDTMEAWRTLAIRSREANEELLKRLGVSPETIDTMRAAFAATETEDS